MIALDTSVLISLATNDAPAHVALATRAIGRQTAWIGITVLLETEWVLRRVYGYERAQVCALLSSLLASAQFELENETAVREAINLTLSGADFADALYLARRPKGTKLLTFDRTFATPAIRRTEVVQILK